MQLTSLTDVARRRPASATTKEDLEGGQLATPRFATPPQSKKQDDPEEPPKYARGQPRVAGFMACGTNLAVFRKFDRMAYGSILHQQDQLLKLENEIDEMNACDEDLINLVPKLRALLPKRTVDRPSSSGIADITESAFRDFCRSDRPKWIEAERWVEVTMKLNEPGSTSLRLQQQIVVRGCWDYMTPRQRKEAFSIVFIPDDSWRAPVVLWEEHLNQTRYPVAASWEFETVGTDQTEVRLQTRASIGDRFEEQMSRYCSSVVDPMPPETTVSFFVRDHEY